MTLSNKYKRIKSKKDSAMEIDEEGSKAPTAVDILEEQMKKIVLEPTMLVKKNPTKRKDRMTGAGLPKKIHKAELINTNLLLT